MVVICVKVKKFIILAFFIISLLQISFSSVVIASSNRATIPDSEAQITKEEAQKNLIVSILSNYTSKSIKEYYGIALPYQIEFAQITDTKMVYSEKGLYFVIKLKVQPFVGAHNPVGTDLFIFKMENCKVTLLEYKHLESFPIPEHLKKYYKDLKHHN